MCCTRLRGRLNHPGPGAELKELEPPKRLGEQVRKLILGVVAAQVHVIEFQKMSLPHVHFLLIMQSGYKLTCPEQYDTIISAELPNKNRYPVMG